MATIRNRGKFQWEARVRRKGHPVVCKTFETKGDAEQWARHIENEMDRGIFVSRVEAENTTLLEALERYIAEYIPRLAHPYKAIMMARQLQRHPLATRFLATIRAKDIGEYIKDREAQGKSGATIVREINMLSRLFNVAAASWDMESLQNPVKKALKPKVAKGRERRLEEGEEERLLKAAWPPFRPIIKFALETAMRRDEIASLTWDHVNLEKRCCFLPETKNGTSRSVPLSPEALRILEALPGREGQVFGMQDYTVTKYMVKACKAAGIENLTFHDLRHEAISRLFENTDLDVMEIKAISGHKSMQMLARYSHLRTHRLADRLAGKKRGE